MVNINFILKKLRNLFLKNTRSNKFLWQGLRVEGQCTKLNLCLYIFARKNLEYERLNTVNQQPFSKYAIKLNLNHHPIEMNTFILKFIRCYKRPSRESRNRPICLWPTDLLHRNKSKLIGKKKKKRIFQQY